MSGALCLYSCMRGRRKQLFGSSMCFSATWLGSEPAFSFWDPDIIIISVFAKEVPAYLSAEDSPRVLPRNPACPGLPVFWKPRQGRELGRTMLAPCFIPSLCISLSWESSSQTPAEVGRQSALRTFHPLPVEVPVLTPSWSFTLRSIWHHHEISLNGRRD